MKQKSRCSKNQLSSTFWYNINPSLKQAIKNLFPEVDLLFKNGRYHVYRRLADDYYIFEFTLKMPPGPWLISHLQQHDAYNKFGKDPRKLLRDYDNEYNKNEENSKKELQELTHNLAKDILFMSKGRVSITV